MSEARQSKVSIVGAGAVGSTLAYAALMRGITRTLALYDINQSLVEAEALDLAQGMAYLPETNVLGSSDIDVVADSDVVVITAGAKQQPGQSRRELAGKAVALVRELLPRLIQVAPNAIYIMVTNPVDVVTYAAVKASGLPPSRVFGSGTVLDSSRLQHRIALECNVGVENVQAYILGEHGDSEVALWSSATIGGTSAEQWRDKAGYRVLTEQVRERIHQSVLRSAYTIIEGKGATNYAIGVAGARILEAVLRDQKRVLPVSTLMDVPGVGELCMSQPSLIGAAGVEQRVEVSMRGPEVRAILASARAIRETADSCGVP